MTFILGIQLTTPWAIINIIFFSLSLSFCLIQLSFSIHFAIKLQLSEGSINCLVIVWTTPTSLSRLQECLFCRFSIDRHTDLERQFNINAEDGKITLATPLDRETNMWHNITIVATETSKYLWLFLWFCDFLLAF